MSLRKGCAELTSGLVGDRSVGRLCRALKSLAEGWAIPEMRLVSCTRPQESQALSENPSTTQKAVVRITALSSADTVKRFSIIGPPKFRPFGQKRVNILDSASAGTTADPRRTDSLRNVERPTSSSLPGTRKPTAR